MITNGCSKRLCPMQIGTVDNCTLTKEQCPYFTQDVDYNKVLNQIKAEVALEIFEEIEREIKNHGITYTQRKIAELKKKYTEEL